MIIRSIVTAGTLVLATSCTIKPSSGMLACNKDADCPESYVCRQIAANDLQRCVDPQTPAWQPDSGMDAGRDAFVDEGEPDAGTDAGTTAPLPDAGMNGARDAGSNEVEDGGAKDPVDSGLQVSGEITVMQTVSAGNGAIRVTEAAIEVQPTLCGPAGAASNKQTCVTGGIRP